MIKITRKLDKDVQHFYDEDTEEYYTVFVKGRSANYEGHSTHVQIQNYKSISMNMALLPSLNLLKTEYDINIGLYSDSVKFSADSKTDLDEQSTLMEAASEKANQRAPFSPPTSAREIYRRLLLPV